MQRCPPHSNPFNQGPSWTSYHPLYDGTGNICHGLGYRLLCLRILAPGTFSIGLRCLRSGLLLSNLRHSTELNMLRCSSRFVSLSLCVRILAVECFQDRSRMQQRDFLFNRRGLRYIELLHRLGFLILHHSKQ